ncbi:MAG: anti-sigma factor antagonist [Candidatus Latescibacterota bacterium]|nr:MAG: anti-sigma factor antagonist [Candidatus Latescibacterota bacterium]
MSQANPSFHVESSALRADPHVVQLALDGRLDAEALPELLSRLEEARAAGCSRFVILLENVSFIGSAGIGIFLSLVEEMKNESGGVVFVRVPPSILRIFEVLNVIEFLQIRSDPDEALRNLLSPEKIPSA